MYVNVSDFGKQTSIGRSFYNFNIPEIVKTSQPPIVEEIDVINIKQKLKKKNTGK